MRGPHSPPDCIYLLFDTSVIFAAHCFRTEDPDETESSAESGGDDSDDELEAPASVEITSGSGSKKKTVTWKRVTGITEDIRTQGKTGTSIAGVDIITLRFFTELDIYVHMSPNQLDGIREMAKAINSTLTIT